MAAASACLNPVLRRVFASRRVIALLTICCGRRPRVASARQGSIAQHAEVSRHRKPAGRGPLMTPALDGGGRGSAVVSFDVEFVGAYRPR